jgi:hypothetical protein
MRALGGVIVGLFTLAGCDAQASTEYRGEPLLAVSGSVELTRQEESANDLCFSTARSEALVRFNAEHDTDYSAFEVMGVQCASANDCDHEVATPEETEEYEALSKDVAIERGCLLATFKSERIADSADHPLLVVFAVVRPFGVGREQRGPLFWFEVGGVELHVDRCEAAVLGGVVAGELGDTDA